MNFKSWNNYSEWFDIVKFYLNVNLLNEEIPWPESLSQEVIESPKFVQWLNSFGIKGPIGKPMLGSVGRAYPVDDNHIVKFTMDRKEASAAAILKGYDSPNLAKVYDVKLVKSFEGKSLYAILQEKINTDISKKHRVAGQAVYDYLDRHDSFITTINIQAVLQFVPNKYKKDKDIPVLIEKLLIGLKKIQDDKGFLSQDTHGGNLGLKGKETSIFDLGRSSINYDHQAAEKAKVAKL